MILRVEISYAYNPFLLYVSYHTLTGKPANKLLEEKRSITGNASYSNN
ncbi:hypothetical protein QSI_0886 [Clostridioides difficile P28]|nr:hypothetical protein QSI_0886 [Clostridioides difficile P28]